MIEALQKQIGGPRDGSLLRFSLGQALLNAGDAVAAAEALRMALQFDPNYSAAWKLLGQALLKGDDVAAAVVTWKHGIDVAKVRGDTQAAKEMTVFLRRAQKSAPDEPKDRTSPTRDNHEPDGSSG